ncbi:hypothetical protein CONCODRAFT_80135 [Conidiobolus coronatus NRRL 28638]|uniref:RNA polymerase Rpb4/RPC9 core domain-containing protein n=1 Tax=Conidiobolus coronatus (strain ATCC 28846 / CBS 209.66 / NRRL 28638) TaxID=796925 RepID=A0A137NXK6_CONC2|nr:hypothetical protein CONCODRAFT_80135 [Conidiobolus coronatus NRRL 28638]|eukprot:KXN67477.1 hypothetical protein CONCODRAFT_80135 [Conidiobolus coronatus NRRL 28638]
MAPLPQIKRPKGKPIETDATILELGPDFNNIRALSVAEVGILLDHQAKDSGRAFTKTFNSTLEYAKKFSRFSAAESVKDVRNIFAEKNFAHYEVAQLVNLCCDTAEEAKTLIPSLKKKMNDPELEGLLTSMLTYKKYQG